MKVGTALSFVPSENLAYRTNANAQPQHKQNAMLRGLLSRTRRKDLREPKDLKVRDPPHGTLLTALVVQVGMTKHGILETALVVLTGTIPHGIQGIPMPGIGMILIHGKVTIVAKVESAASHATETMLIGGIEFFKQW